MDVEAALIAVWPYVSLGLAALVGVQQLRIADLQVDQARQAASQANAQKEQAVLGQAATEKKSAALLDHAEGTQTNVYEYTQKITKLEAARVADAGRIAGLQHSLRTTSTQHAQAASDLAACRHLADRHEKLGALAARSVGVIGGAISLVQQRDAEVMLLKGQVLTERATVERLLGE